MVVIDYLVLLLVCSYLFSEIKGVGICIGLYNYAGINILFSISDGWNFKLHVMVFLLGFSIMQ